MKCQVVETDIVYDPLQVSLFSDIYALERLSYRCFIDDNDNFVARSYSCRTVWDLLFVRGTAFAVVADRILSGEWRWSFFSTRLVEWYWSFF